MGSVGDNRVYSLRRQNAKKRIPAQNDACASRDLVEVDAPGDQERRKGHQDRRRRMVGEYVNKCPLCRATYSGYDVAGQIDAVGVARCPRCGGTITKKVLYTYLNEEGEREKARRDKEWRQPEHGLQKRWWQFWK
jgi:hypothetical protein